jgi:hypothetical protein
LKFLGLPEWNPDRYSKYNDSGGYPEMNLDTRQKLTEYFRPYNEKLYEYLGVDFGWDSL